MTKVIKIIPFSGIQILDFTLDLIKDKKKIFQSFVIVKPNVKKGEEQGSNNSDNIFLGITIQLWF